ncbi:hypothetical protein BT63DRAFT_56048 [Microthyrium microscopicum]|uniref:Zn(2)-C6 fungal-type domain-containing protein n=1 Tax=Microthyrium microscopicum TaxID=703497 RepID=A0A6A6U3V8_9PEZI|nr:hypothetical protein BT63DRAFT_56048 [Microthyrium microscopicum]
MESQVCNLLLSTKLSIPHGDPDNTQKLKTPERDLSHELDAEESSSPISTQSSTTFAAPSESSTSNLITAPTTPATTTQTSSAAPSAKKATPLYLSSLSYHISPPCLQCALKGLPCDARKPACTRCERTEPSSPCLLQRARLVEEEGSSVRQVRYTLLRLDCDDEDTWATKIALEDALVEELRQRLDKLNWVLRNPLGPRESFCPQVLEVAKRWADVHHMRGKRTSRWIGSLEHIKLKDPFM